MPESVRVQIPLAEGFAPIPRAAPTLQSDATRIVSFEAYGRGDLTVASACTLTPLSVWTEEARPFVLEKAEGLLAKIGTSINAPRLQRSGDHAGNIDRLDFSGSHAAGVTFVTFVQSGGSSSLAVCAAACASSDDCPNTLSSARVEAALLPKPPPSFSIRLLLGAVHHPEGTALGVAAVLLVSGLLAVLFRRRPAAT